MTTESDSTMQTALPSDEADLNHVLSKKKMKEKHQLAKDLHELAWIYKLYGLLDGINLSYSMLKYIFDLKCTTGSELSSDIMHEWMMSPTGFAISNAEAVTIIGFSLIANVYDSEKNKNSLQKFITSVWPYMRDGMKGLKNGYKGVRGLSQAVSLLSGQDFRHLIVPVVIVLGVISMLNRMWYRSMKEERKTYMKQNSELLQKIQNLRVENMDAEDLAEFRWQIKHQSTGARAKLLLSAAYGGIVDGLYLFMGSLGVATLAPAVLTSLSVFCIVFSVICIATRIYEEYDFQRGLLATQAKVELAICGKELESIFKSLQFLSNPMRIAQTEKLRTKQELLFKALEQKLKEFEEKRDLLRSHLTLSYTSAMFAGLRDGLAAYGALASGIFALAAVYTIMLAPFPPTLLISSVLLGGVFLIGFMFNSLIQNYWHLREMEQKNTLPDRKLGTLLTDIKSKRREVQDLKPEEFSEAILGDMIVDQSPQFHFQEGFEVIRSLCSGITKGPKAIDFMMNSWQERDEQGHYHDSRFMLAVGLIGSTVYAGGLALRAYARGFGRPPIDEVTPPEGTERRVSFSDELSESDFEEAELIECSSRGDSVSGTPPRSNSPVSVSENRWFQFFRTPSPTKSVSRTISVCDLAKLDKAPPNLSNLAPNLQ